VIRSPRACASGAVLALCVAVRKRPTPRLRHYIGNPKREAKVRYFELTLGDLGVIFHNSLSFKQFCLKVASVATFHIRSLSKIRDNLSRDLISRLCTSFILSRLDSCNSLLAGLPKCFLRLLQLAQNMAARLRASPPARQFSNLRGPRHPSPRIHPEVVFSFMRLLIYSCMKSLSK